MKIVVIGAEGQVGHFLNKQLKANHEVVGTSMLGVDGFPALDICKESDVSQAVGSIKPDHVILPAAFTHVDGCEQDPDKAFAINVQGPEYVAKACRESGAGLTFLSSEYVFDGHDGPYSEEDQPNPESVYGKTKLEAENRIAQLLENHIIVRTTVVYSYLPGSFNFFMQLLNRAEKNESIRVPGDQIGNPTQASNLAGAIGELIEKNQTGIFNLVGTTRIGRDGFARKLLDAIGHQDKTFDVVSTETLNQAATRPLNAGLTTDKAQNVLEKNKLMDLDQALAFTIRQMQERSQNG